MKIQMDNVTEKREIRKWKRGERQGTIERQETK